MYSCFVVSPDLLLAAEQGFDRLFHYDRPLTESFEYYNTMKNGNIRDQLKMQEKELSGERKNTQENGIVPDSASLVANKQESKQLGIHESSNSISQQTDKSVNQSSDSGLSSVFGIFSPTSKSNDDEPQTIKSKKKKKKGNHFKR